jgi:hypothetical protein
MNKKEILKKNHIIIMIIYFLNLRIDELMQLNLLNKKFYNEIIPEFFLKSGKRFDCSMRNRIVFCKNDKIYEIKEIDDQFG